MRSDEKNFFYLKGTNIEKYYDDLIKAEYICDDYGDVSKIILRKVIEELLRNIARKYDMECNIGINSLINNIKYNCNVNCLYEQDDSISKKEMIIKEQLEQVRKSYKTELGFSKKYIDILNTIEFSYDEEVKKN